jgi:CheY-like chemotaxis protein/predicted transcriptional regulator
VAKSGAFSFDVIKRILESLEEHGPMKRTRLASAAGLNFNVCKRYLDLLEPIGWIISDPEPRITSTGKQINHVLANPKIVPAQSEQKPFSRHRSSVPKGERTSQRATTGTIMIVDDEQDVALTYESFLSEKGFKVKSFLDTFSALKEFADNPNTYDLAILDIRMPDMNGLQLYQSLRVMNGRCKFLFVSALDAAAELTTLLPGIEAGQIIRKPIELGKFVDAVRDALED